MIVLPQLGKTSSSQPTQLINPSAAAAPYQALSQVGRGLQKVGDEAADISLKIQEAENQVEISKALRTMSTAQAEFERSLQDDHDYKGYGKRAEHEVIEPARKMITPDLPPAVRRELTGRMDAWEHQLRLRTNEKSDAKKVERAKHGLAAEREMFLENGDLSGWNKRVDEQGYLTPEERSGLKADGLRYHRRRQTEIEIQRDPEGWLDKNKDKTSGDPARQRALVRLARGVIMERTREAFDEAEDLMVTGKLVDDEQVEKLFPDLRPAAREKLKNMVARYQDEGLRKEMASSENQELISGRVSAMLREYDPSGEDFDRDYADIKDQIGMMAPSGLKDEYKRKLDGLRGYAEDAAEEEIKTKSDWAFLQLDEHHEALAPTKTKGKALGAYLDDGLLQDAGILEQFGFNESIAGKIAKLAAKDQKAAIEMLRTEWNSSNARDEDFPEHLGAALDAIRAHKGPTHEVMTPSKTTAFEEAEATRTRTLGRSKLELANWLKLNPEAGMPEIQKELKEMGIRIEAGASNAGNFRPAPRRKVGGKALDEISSIDLPRNLTDHEKSYLKWGKKYGVDPRFLAAISRLETNNGKSSAFRNKKNAMGVSDAKGPISFRSVDASIERMARVLSSKKGPYRNANTLAEIGKVYAPPGAGNDVNGTNGYWPRGVAKYLREQGVASPFTKTLVSR